MELPLSDDQLVAECRREYQQAIEQGQASSSEAGIRYAWALVHHSNQDYVWQGLNLASTLMSGPQLKEHSQREVVYLRAVAQYRLGKHTDAKHQVDELLKVAPNMRQAQNLQGILQSTIAKEALIGVGIGAGLLGVAALVVAGIASRR